MLYFVRGSLSFRSREESGQTRLEEGESSRGVVVVVVAVVVVVSASSRSSSRRWRVCRSEGDGEER